VNDGCLKQLHLAWEEASREQKWRWCAKIIRSIIIYCRQRYGAVAKFKDLLEPKISYLEAHILEIKERDLLAVTSAIAYGRKQISESGEQFGTGFLRPPTESERSDIQGTIAHSVDRLKNLVIPSTVDSPSLNDFRANGMGDD
jgi:hypothetical protein